ncbi:MAG: PIN domain-containing protein [Phycisphaerae bacterium]|nr:PIN domain-containing protein [Phycisphaerae bacterium]
MNAIDTNVLIYTIDVGDAGKRRRSLELIESLPESETIIPWQVACEVGAVLRKMERLGRFRGDYESTVSALRCCFPIALPGVGVLSRAARIEADTQVSPWDALLLAACAEAGVTKLFTEDIQSRRVVEGVTIVTPFE